MVRAYPIHPSALPARSLLQTPYLGKRTQETYNLHFILQTDAKSKFETSYLP